MRNKNHVRIKITFRSELFMNIFRIAEMSPRKYKTRDNPVCTFGCPSIKFAADSQIGKKEFSFAIQNKKNGKLSVLQYNPLELNKDYPGSEDYFVSNAGVSDSCQNGELRLLVQVKT